MQDKDTTKSTFNQLFVEVTGGIIVLSPDKLKNAFKKVEEENFDLGITVESIGNRAVVAIYCRVDMAYIDDSYDEYEDYYGDENEEDEFDIPIPQDKKTGKDVVEQFRSILN